MHSCRQKKERLGGRQNFQIKAILQTVTLKDDFEVIPESYTVITEVLKEIKLF